MYTDDLPLSEDMFTIEDLGNGQYCVILEAEQSRSVFEKFVQDYSDEFASKVFETPSWTKIKYSGPKYIPTDFEAVTLRNKITNEPIPLDEDASYIAFLFTNHPAKNDPVFRQNFWSSFSNYLPSSVTDLTSIDFSALPTHDTEKLPAPTSYAEIDGQLIRVSKNKLPGISIYYGSPTDRDRGYIKRAILPADVTINSLKPNSVYKNTEYTPGVFWAAKWFDPLTEELVYATLDFHRDEDAEDDQEEEEEEEEEITDYMDEEVDSDDDEATPSGEIDLPEEVDDSGEMIILTDMDEEEYNLLPLSYILSTRDQWRILNRTVHSQFSDVRDLEKVGNKILRLVANACEVKGGRGRSCRELKKYAYQRGV